MFVHILSIKPRLTSISLIVANTAYKWYYLRIMERKTEVNVNQDNLGVKIVTKETTLENFPDIESAEQLLNTRKAIITLHAGIKSLVGLSALSFAIAEIPSGKNEDLKSYLIPAFLGLLSIVSFKEVYYDTRSLKRTINPQIKEITKR